MVLNTAGLGGVPQVAYQFTRHLPREKYDFKLFLLKSTPADDAARSALLAQFNSLDMTVKVASGRGGKFGAISELVTWLNAEHIDLLHTHSYRPNLYARTAGLICRSRGLRIVAHYHNQYDDKWSQNPDLLGVERQLAESTDAMIAVSYSVRDHIAEQLELSPERLSVIHNGCDSMPLTDSAPADAKAKFGVAADRPMIGLVGRICEQKGQADLVEAAAMLKQQHPGVVVLLIGDTEDKSLYKRLQARIGQLKLEETVRFTGHLDDMGKVYCALDVLVAPSRWEGFGLMLVEAMAAGTPIVASNVGAIPEVVEDGKSAVLVPPREPEVLAAAVSSLLHDKERCEQLSAAGRSRYQHFNWPTAARQLEQVYDRVLIRSPG